MLAGTALLAVGCASAPSAIGMGRASRSNMSRLSASAPEQIRNWTMPPGGISPPDPALVAVATPLEPSQGAHSGALAFAEGPVGSVWPSRSESARRAVRQLAKKFIRCYDRVLSRASLSSGEIVLHVRLRPNGRAASVRAKADNEGLEWLIPCLESMVMTYGSFPPPDENAGSSQVTIPLRFLR